MIEFLKFFDEKVNDFPTHLEIGYCKTRADGTCGREADREDDMGMTIEGFDDVIKMLDRYSKKSNVDDVAKKAVNAAKGIVEGSMKSAISASEGHKGSPGKRHREDRSTGSIAASVKATEAKVNSYGVYSVSRPTGRDSQGKRNGEKAAYLQYGTSTLAARPWREKSISGAEAECVKIVEEIVAAELGAE